MERRKVILFIVEGPTEEMALKTYLQALYPNNTIMFHVVKGDLTTVKNKVRSKVTIEFKKFLSINHLRKSDVKEIVEITDTDGSFISMDLIKEDIQIRHTIYKKNKIITKDKRILSIRNTYKRYNIQILMNTDKIINTSYHIYYNSLNLDQILSDNTNIQSYEKVRYANMFAQKYSPEEFLNYYINSSFSDQSNYYDSWKYISLNNNSLQKHTNFSIYLKNQIK